MRCKWWAGGALALVVVLGTAIVADAAMPAAAKAASFPTYGISFVPPAGATAQPGAELSPGVIASYQLAKPSPAAGAMIMVERMAAHGASADQLAASIAGQVQGGIDQALFMAGGEKAVHIVAQVHEEAFTSRSTYVTVHGSQAYLISALSTAQAAAAPIAEAMLKTVAFTAPESPVKHLADFFPAPLEAFGISMNGPACLRRVQADANGAQLGIFDFSGNDGSFTNPLSIEVQHIVTKAASPFVAIRDTYSGLLQKQMSFAQPLTWKQQPGTPGLYFTQPVKGTVDTGRGRQEKLTARYCIVELQPGNFVQILFSVPDSAADQSKDYMAVSDRVIATIKRLPSSSKHE